MQHRLVILLAAGALVGVGVLVACGDDSGTVPLPTGGSSSGASSSGHATSGGPTQGDDDDGGATDGGDAGPCATAPRLHKTSVGFYCGHFADAGPDAGGKSNCALDETCCNPGKDGTTFPPSFCAYTATKDDNGQETCSGAATAYGSTWVVPGSTTWECAAADDCSAGQLCCAMSADGADAGNYVNVGKYTGTGAPPPECNAQFIYKIAGTKCATQCSTADKSELELCSSTAKCSGGATCKPAATTGSRELGYCAP